MPMVGSGKKGVATAINLSAQLPNLTERHMAMNAAPFYRTGNLFGRSAGPSFSGSEAVRVFSLILSGQADTVCHRVWSCLHRAGQPSQRVPPSRPWHLRGQKHVAVSKLRHGTFFTGVFFERRSRAEWALPRSVRATSKGSPPAG